MGGLDERLRFLFEAVGATAVVKGINDISKSTTKAGTETQAASSKMSTAFAGIGKAAGSALAVGAIVNFEKSAVDAASNLAEVQSKTTVIFGDASKAVLDWSKTTADSMGQSQRAALEAATTFATFGKSAGLAGSDLVGFSEKLVGLSSDLASFSNTTPEDAVLAVGAALRGESEPIRRYGVLLNDATLKQRAFSLGLIKTTTDALTPQNRVLAAQAEILAQTTAAQGDFARTAGGAANQARTLQAEFENLKAAIGEQLLPAVIELEHELIGLEKTAGPLIPVLGKVGEKLRSVGAAGNLAFKLKDWAQGFKEWTQGVDGVFQPTFEMGSVTKKVADEVLPPFIGKVRDAADALRDNRQATLDTAAAQERLASDKAAAALRDVGYAADAAKDKLDKVKGAYDALRDDISGDQSWVALQQQVGDVQAELDEFNKKNSVAVGAKDKKGNVLGFKDAKEQRDALLQLRSDLDGVKQSTLDVAEALGNVPPQIVSNILLTVDQEQLDQALAKLAILKANTDFIKSFTITSGGDTYRNGQGSRTTLREGGYVPNADDGRLLNQSLELANRRGG